MAALAKQQTTSDAWAEKDLNKTCIVGMACKLPGAESSDAYWKNLIAGNECTNQVRKWQNGYETKAGFLADIKCFDPAFFNISPYEAVCMDPQQRLLLEVSWHAIESSGLSIETLKSINTGIFTSSLPSDYKNLLKLNQKASSNTYSFLGNAPSALSGRLSYFYDFNGPSITIDTACSSGLTALNIARLSIESGECNAALVGGATLFSTSEFHQLASQANMISAKQHCAVFDESADGFVPSEATVVLVIVKLEHAIELKLHVYGLIDSLCWNHDGLSNGLMAPNSLSQQSVIQQALQSSELSFDDLGMIETHGTGTKLGDLIELRGLASALGDTDIKGSCYLGASKTIIGHTLVCASLASLIKVLLSYQYRLIPPNHLFTKASENASIAPFIINQTSVKWPDDKYYAGISAFGFTGSNAHLILKFPNKKTINVSHLFEHFFIFSAENCEKLEVIINNLRDFLIACAEISLADISTRLIRKPKYFSHRVAVYAKDRQSLVLNLQNISLQTPTVQFYAEGQDTNAYAIIQAWLKGDNAQLSAVFLHLNPSVLPSYPFLRDEYWITHSLTLRNKKNEKLETILEVIKSILSSLLHYEKLTIDENKSLLELGIDSLTAIQLIDALREKNIDVKIESVWNTPSLTKFADGLKKNKGEIPYSPFSEKNLSLLSLSLKENLTSTSALCWVVSQKPGIPIILLPPLNTNYLVWLRQIPLLHTQAYQLHIPHYPGHYPSTFNPNQPFSLQIIVKQIIHYLDKNKLHAHFIGWSLGGIISLLIALTKPDLMQSMTLVNSATHFDSELFAKTIEIQNELQSLQNFLSIVYQTQEDIDKHICAKSEMSVLNYYYQSLMELNISAFDLQKINIPTFIAYGEKDPILSTEQNKFFAYIKRAKIKPYVDSGHFIPLTETHQFNPDLLAFLSKVEKSHA
jgi:3-oxoacyl-(acyl-carrier-protein) synthase/pimeloyl-ACP methyl ester carboxylesterase/acyl carrier protein